MNDKQDYRQLIADLRECAWQAECQKCSRYLTGSDCIPTLKTAAADAIETLLNGIEAYRRAAHREWHDAKSDPPKSVGRYLVARYDFVTRSLFIDLLWFDNDRWCNRLYYQGEWNVIYWMPLPKPPEVK